MNTQNASLIILLYYLKILSISWSTYIYSLWMVEILSNEVLLCIS